jgi:hypothetical protein
MMGANHGKGRDFSFKLFAISPLYTNQICLVPTQIPQIFAGVTVPRALSQLLTSMVMA